MTYVALAGPLLALGFLLLMQVLERWLAKTVWQDKVVAEGRARTDRPGRSGGEVVDAAPVAVRVRAHGARGRAS